jgi:acyl-CoA synthetase (AMP-forming)/AMP-acid ligase II
MLYVNDSHYDAGYFERCYAAFARHPALRDAPRARTAVCSADAAFSLAVCLYLRANGGTVFPLPVDTPVEAARRRAAQSGCTHLLFGPDAEAALAAVESITPASEPTLTASGPGLVQTSSGTTGEPKFIARSWSSIETELASYVRHFDAARLAPLVACPVNHSYGLICGVLAALERGVQPVVVTNANPKYLLRKLHEAASPLLYASPPLLAAVAMLARDDTPIFAAVTSGTTLSEAAFERIRAKVRHLCQQYGCSEAGCLTFGQDISAANDLGTPLAHVSLSAGQGAAEPAEIVATLSASRVHTRDLGYFEDGTLRYVARIDDMINVAGLNVYPSDVEEVVTQLPGVTDAVVFKTDGGFGGEHVSLQFVAERPLQPAEIRAWCARKLSSHQVPMRIAQVSCIPRMPNGKISRKALSEASRQGPASARVSS